MRAPARRSRCPSSARRPPCSPRWRRSPARTSRERRSTRSLRAAVTFLTRIPFPGDGDFGGATVYFPVVGALVGAIGAGVYWLASAVWPPIVAVTLSTAATVLVTGALHEDGLADAADGFGGGRSPDRIIEIMHDSRIGSYGAVALILVVITKLAALASLPRADAALALIAGHTLARWSSVALLRIPYVGAKGAAFSGSATGTRLIIASVLALVISAGALQRAALIAIPVAVAVTVVAGVYFRRRLGGVTGDCLGAANQLVEVAVYLALSARSP